MAVDILPIESLYSVSQILRWYVDLLGKLLLSAAISAIICVHVASRVYSILLGTFVALCFFIFVDLYAIYSNPYSLIPSAGLYILHVIGYAAGAVLLASTARTCAELDEADWQPRRRLLLMGVSSMIVLAALYVFWLLPLPTHFALTASEWRTATVALRPGRLPRISARLHLPETYQDSVMLDLGVKRLMMSDLLLSEGEQSISLRIPRARSAVICWPTWLQLKNPHPHVSKIDGRNCLDEKVHSRIMIRGDLVGMQTDLKEAEDKQRDAMFVPPDSKIILRRESGSSDLFLNGLPNAAFSIEMRRLSGLEFDIDRFRAMKFLMWDLLLGSELENIVKHRTAIMIAIDEIEFHFADTMDLSPESIIEENIITWRFGEDADEKGRARIDSSISSSLVIDESRDLYWGLGVNAVSLAGAKGRIKNGEATIDLARLDEVFVGGNDLQMKLERSGGVEVHGKVTHAVVNGRVMWRAMGHFIPSEVWAATIGAAVGAAVSFVLSVLLLRGRVLMDDAKH